MGPGTWASGIVGTAQGFKVSKGMEAAAKDAVRGLLGHTVMWVFDHIPIPKGDAARPHIGRKGSYKGGQGDYKFVVEINKVGGVSIGAQNPNGFGALLVVELGEEGVARDQGVAPLTRPGAVGWGD